jgi:RNA polymerase sigma-70 factor, ECF subfamily
MEHRRLEQKPQRGAAGDGAPAVADDEFLKLLNGHRSQLLGYLFCLVRNMADAEDLFQQVSITLWDKFDEYEPGTNFAGWASTVARNKALTFLRSKGRERARFSDQVVDELSSRPLWSSTEVDGRVAALVQCQQKLSQRDQALLALCYGTDSTTTDVATEINRPVESVYSSLSRIRRSLYRCIERTLARESHA